MRSDGGIWGMFVIFLPTGPGWTHLDVAVDREMLRSGHFPMSQGVSGGVTLSHHPSLENIEMLKI